jgi:UDP-N-acetyl-D-mannosaminuronic acid dehydrogenase
MAHPALESGGKKGNVMQPSELIEKIETRQAVVGVIGLGYVGLAAAAVLAEAGFMVRGIDRAQARVDRINAGQNPVQGDEPGLSELIAAVVRAGRLRASLDHADLRAADVVLIAVETPIDADRQPRYDALRAACAQLTPKPGALVVIESTLAPGTMQRVIKPLLEQVTGRQVDVHFLLGHCPERLTAGKLLHNLRYLSRVCGAESPETRRVMLALYRTIVQADVDAVDWVTAELIKTGENAYRDVNIAFANEFSRICEELGGDFWQARALINKLPGWNVLLAGAGVGGHCLPKDPWLLLAKVRDYAPHVIPAARAVNEAMPAHVVELTRRALDRHERALAGAHVAVLGFSYLPNSDDTRNSPSAAVADLLRAAGADVSIHDPFVPAYRVPLEAIIEGVDALLVLVAHSIYADLDLARLRQLVRTPLIVDARHVIAAQAAHAAGFDLVSLGIGT